MLLYTIFGIIWFIVVNYISIKYNWNALTNSYELKREFAVTNIFAIFMLSIIFVVVWPIATLVMILVWGIVYLHKIVLNYFNKKYGSGE